MALRAGREVLLKACPGVNGTACVRGGDVGGGEHGCGLYFCANHRRIGAGFVDQCTRCFHRKPPYPPKPDTVEWIKHQLTDESWAEWRRENRELVLAMYARIFFDAVPADIEGRAS
jgi:hypothetical protein